jgi:hypothetical protein
LGESLINDGCDGFYVAAGSDFGHHAAISCVQVHAAQYYIAQLLCPRAGVSELYYGSSCFVTTGFDT